MVSDLDEARHISSDPPDAPDLVVTRRVSTGGRPRIEIDPQFLSQALDLRGTTHLARVFNCSSRTVRRRALAYGLALPGAPVYTDTSRPDGTVARTYSSTTRAMSTLTDEQLDTLLVSMLEVFPDFGRRMLMGRLKAAGHHVPRDRITASYLRVHGAPGRFGLRLIHRRPYTVAGANSLWHHDGQHAHWCRRSVHNTRIERLWYDVTHGFGQKWKKFFMDLEVHHGLNPQVPAHVWLLHHLFLHHINADAQEWAEAWNSHHLNLRGERNRSPRDIFHFASADP
ncbi:hypothetical protein C8R47DRAFT_984653 [Mycena vitilis]|nr:hypothetical protein C8R47DRAFT_984653 [Mycena vitilis]